MTPRWSALAWDTEFFGIPIGRIDLEGLDAEAIAAEEADARAAGIACLYATLDPADLHRTAAVQALGYRFLEAGTMFSLAVDRPPIPRPEGIEVRFATEDDLPELIPLVEVVAPWSRFAVDPRFPPDAAARLQVAWAERATRDASGDHAMLVATDATGAIVAFVTLAVEPGPRVAGVGTVRSGSGAATYLVQEARAWAGDRPLLTGPVAARNVPSLRWAGRCGSEVVEVRYQYHRWLDEASGTFG